MTIDARLAASTLTVAIFLAPSALASTTSWLAPRDGAFADPANWTSGVPTTAKVATFGIDTGGPFTVTLSQAQACDGLQITNQSVTLDGSAARGASLAAYNLSVGGQKIPSLTIRHCTLTAESGAQLGGTEAPGTLTIGEGGALHLTGGMSLDGYTVPALLDLSPSAIVTAHSISNHGTIRWTIDGAAACTIQLADETWIEGALRIAIGPNGHPAPGTVIPLVTSVHPCREADSITFEGGAAVVGNAVVRVENEQLVYRQLAQAPTLTLTIPVMPRLGFNVDVRVVGIADGLEFELSNQAALATSDPRVVGILGPGRIIGLAPGSATITATDGESSVSALVTVGPPDVTFVGSDDDNGNAKVRGLSADGRLVLFESASATLVPNDTNGANDVFVRDLETGAIERVSEGPNGEQGSLGSRHAAMSGDGRFVAFKTAAPEIQGVVSFGEHLLVKDRVTGAVEFVTQQPDGTPVLAFATRPYLSFDGQFILFQCASTQLAPDTPVTATTCFVRDRLTGTTTWIGSAPDGTPLNLSRPAALSSDGSIAAILAFGDDSIVVRDLATGATTLEADDVDLGDWSAYGFEPEVAMSDDGRYLAYPRRESVTADLQIAVLDRLAQTTDYVHTFDAYEPDDRSLALSGDGRYLAFHVWGFEEDGCVSTYDAVRYDRVGGLIEQVDERPGMTTEVDSFGHLALSADGHYCAFSANWAMGLLPYELRFRSALRRDFAPALVGDLDGDGAISASDLTMLLAAWGSSESSADLDDDGVVDSRDLAILLGAWSP